MTAVILSTISILVSLWLIRPRIICGFKGHDRIRLIYLHADGLQYVRQFCQRCHGVDNCRLPG